MLLKFLTRLRDNYGTETSQIHVIYSNLSYIGVREVMLFGHRIHPACFGFRKAGVDYAENQKVAADRRYAN